VVPGFVVVFCLVRDDEGVGADVWIGAEKGLVVVGDDLEVGGEGGGGPFGDCLGEDGGEVVLGSGVGEAVADGLGVADEGPGAEGAFGFVVVEGADAVPAFVVGGCCAGD